MSNPVPGFNGERADPLNHTYPLGNGYRAYNPRLRCFHCPDGWSPFGAGGINSYAYCAGDPVNRADPSGHLSISGAIGVSLGFLGIILTPVTGGMSLAAVLSATAVLTGVASIGLGVASEVVHDTKTSEILGWTAIALGIISGIAVSSVVRFAPEATSLVGRAGLVFGSSSRSNVSLPVMSRESWELSIRAAMSEAGEDSSRYMRAPPNTVPRLMNLAVDAIADNPSLKRAAGQVLPPLLTNHVRLASGDWLLDLQGPIHPGGNVPARAFLARKVLRAGQVARGVFPEYAPSEIMRSDVARRYLLPLLEQHSTDRYMNNQFVADIARGLYSIEPEDEYWGGVRLGVLPANLRRFLHNQVLPNEWQSVFSDNVLPQLPW